MLFRPYFDLCRWNNEAGLPSGRPAILPAAFLVHVPTGATIPRRLIQYDSRFHGLTNDSRCLETESAAVGSANTGRITRLRSSVICAYFFNCLCSTWIGFLGGCHPALPLVYRRLDRSSYATRLERGSAITVGRSSPQPISFAKLVPILIRCGCELRFKSAIASFPDGKLFLAREKHPLLGAFSQLDISVAENDL